MESVRATDAVTNLQDYVGRDGLVPTARGGIRRNFNDGEYLRVAGYVGFRVPTLNELYRPFRVGNDVTQANAALRPEKLYGAELGYASDWDVLFLYEEKPLRGQEARSDEQTALVNGLFERLITAVKDLTIRGVSVEMALLSPGSVSMTVNSTVCGRRRRPAPR